MHVRIAVNLSARLLQDTGFPARLRELLEESGVSAASLELEITESAMMLDPARALRVIQEIDKLGVLISIDDFGTGYSSLGYLRDLPVHSLKLDKSFVMGMRNNSDDRIIVESTAQMAHALRARARGRRRRDRMGRAVPGGRRLRLRAGLPLLAARCRPTNAWPGSWSSTPPPCSPPGDTTVTTALRARAEMRGRQTPRRAGPALKPYGLSLGTHAKPIWNPMSGVLLRFCRFSVTANDTTQQSKRCRTPRLIWNLSLEQLVEIRLLARGTRSCSRSPAD